MTVRLYCSGPDCEGDGHRSGVGPGEGGKAVPVCNRRKGEEQG